MVRAGHPLLADDADIFARLEDYPVLMPTRGSISWPFVQRLLIANGVSAMPAECIETVSDAFGRAFLRQRDAVWIISQGGCAMTLPMAHCICSTSTRATPKGRSA